MSSRLKYVLRGVAVILCFELAGYSYATGDGFDRWFWIGMAVAMVGVWLYPSRRQSQ